MQNITFSNIIAMATVVLAALDLFPPFLVAHSERQNEQMAGTMTTKHAAFSEGMHLMAQGLQNLDRFGCRTPEQMAIDPVEISRVRANLLQLGSNRDEALRLFNNIMGTGEVPPNPVRSLYAMDALAKAALGESWLAPENALPLSHDSWLSLPRSPDPAHPTCPEYQFVASR